jgi:hypothetical protein
MFHGVLAGVPDEAVRAVARMQRVDAEVGAPDRQPGPAEIGAKGAELVGDRPAAQAPLDDPLGQGGEVGLAGRGGAGRESLVHARILRTSCYRFHRQ